MCKNNLKLNDSKTELLTLGSKSQLSKLGDVSISIGQDTIPASVNAKNIGLMFYSAMEMVAQINHITKLCCYLNPGVISQICKYLTRDAAGKLVHTFVTSRVDNNNSLLYGIADYLIAKLQLIQNNTNRVITQKRK